MQSIVNKQQQVSNNNNDNNLNSHLIDNQQLIIAQLQRVLENDIIEKLVLA